MKQTKIIKQRACMTIFTIGLCLAGLHGMGVSDNSLLVTGTHECSISYAKISVKLDWFL